MIRLSESAIAFAEIHLPVSRTHICGSTGPSSAMDINKVLSVAHARSVPAGFTYLETPTLIKLYAAMKGIPIMQWSHRKIEEFVRNNVEKKLRPLFVNLLDKGDALYKHFYEGHMTPETFEIRWNQALKLIEEIRKRLQI